MNTTERASHPSRAQVDYLLEYMHKNLGLAKGFCKVPSARESARRSWENLSLRLNSMGGCVKTPKQWTKYWADKKSAVKKKSALRYRARNKTGGGAEVVELNEVEEKIVALMGGESFASGDRHLEINPFETSATTSQEVGGSISLLEFNTIGIDATSLKMESLQHHVTPSTSSNVALSLRIPESTEHTAYSPLHTPLINEPASLPLPATPSGSGAHPTQRQVLRSATQRCVLESPTHNQPTPITPPSNHRRQRRHTVAPPTQRLSQFSHMTERFLAVEEQRIELERQNSLLLSAFVNQLRERDTATSQALLAIGEGLKLLAEAVNKINCIGPN